MYSNHHGRGVQIASPPMTKKAGAAGSLISLLTCFSPAFVAKERPTHLTHLLSSKCYNVGVRRFLNLKRAGILASSLLSLRIGGSLVMLS